MASEVWQDLVDVFCRLVLEIVILAKVSNTDQCESDPYCKISNTSNIKSFDRDSALC